jgi:hypothetical protein
MPLMFDQLYKSFGVRGFSSPTSPSRLKDQPVFMRGYDAAAPRHTSSFSRATPGAVPFCQSDADWPVDIVVIY